MQVGSRLAVMLYGIHLGASAATVGLLSALFSVISIFTSLRVGRWIDRSGARVPMVLGAGMVTLGTAMAAVWGQIAGLFVVAAIVGTFYNLTFISQQRLAGQYGRPEDRVSNFSWVSLGQSAAGTVGPVLAGFGIEHAGYAETFMIFAVIAAIPFGGLALGFLPFPPAQPRATREATGHTGTLALMKQDVQLRRMFVVSALTSSTWSIVIFLIPLYGTQIGLSASTIGLIIGGFSVATVVIRVALPWLSRHLKPWQLLIASMALTAFAFLPVPVFTSVTVLTVLAALMGVGLGLCGPLSQAILYDISPPDRIGELLGLRVTALNMSHAGMPVLSGALGTAIGVGPVFWIVAACLFAGSWYIREEWRTPAKARRT